MIYKFTVGIFLLFVSVSNAGAAVLDFEGLTTNPAESIADNNQGYGGFTWNSDLFIYNDNYYNTPAHSGDYALVNDYGASPISVTSSTAFDFNGVWIAGWDFNSPTEVKAQGYDAYGNLVADTGWMNVAVNSYQYLAANFVGVSRIDFVGGQYFTLDDFTYNNVSQTPLPAAAWMFGSGVLGLIAMSRRKKYF